MQLINKRSVVAAAASAVLMFGTLTPLAFAEDITISGNGQGSTSTSNVSAPQTNTVSQSNSANITNKVTTQASSGDNHANGNTGGDVTVGTGAATSTVHVTNSANANVADPSPCCNSQNGSVTVSGNGKDSFNTANLSAPQSNSTTQDNNAHISNWVSSEASSGDNHANGNTGGDTSISTGAATSDVTIHNSANANVLSKGTSVGAGSGTLSVKILDNGEKSVNTINLVDPQSNTVKQSNSANIFNSVDSEAESGGNHANSNTGGDTTIGTGSASSTVDVSNLANFNSADIDCGCLVDLTAKIAGNGEKTFNTINAALGNSLTLGQWNGGEGLRNDVSPEASSGDNSSNGNTMGTALGGDPTVHTGPTDSHVTLSNSANANVAGSSMSPMVTLPGGLSLSFGFDLSAILAMLAGH